MAERIVFSRSLYAEDAVQGAVRAFEHLARFEVHVLDDDIEVEVSDVDPDVADVLNDELCNHALAATATQGRGR